MSFDSCLFAVRLGKPADLEQVRRRLGALARFYAGFGDPRVESNLDRELRLLTGRISFSEKGDAAGPVMTWGEPLPEDLRDAGSLLEAGAEDLRRIAGATVALAQGGGRALLVTGSGSLTCAYESRHGDLGAWATHAVAAAYLAHGRVSVRENRMPELVARGFVGGGRSLVGKARALPIATKISFTTTGGTTASYWPARERWAPVPEQDAFDEAAASLQATLGRRIGMCASPKLGLTGGLDSTVVALSLARAGQRFDTFTWGEPDWPDALQAQATARALGVGHQLLSPEYRRGPALLRAIDEEVRWNEGAAPISFHARRWPQGLDGVIFGTGGETGRAFYYDHDLVRTFPHPSSRQLRRFFDARKAIFHADRAAKEELRAQEGRWLQEAAAAGVAGWRCLDVIYNDQRVCNWARSMLPRLRALTIGAFATPAVARALISLPVQERLRDGFHLRFLAGPEGLARESSPPPPEPGALRRLLASAPGARLAGHNVRRLRGPSPGPPWYARDLWDEQSEFRDWLCQEVLESPLVIGGLGRRWAREARRGLLAGETRPTEGVLQAAGPVALSKAVSGLPDLSRVPT